MSRRNLIAIILALVAAAVCLRLGFWQLHRLAERRALNARVTERMRGAPVEAGTVRDTAGRRYQRVFASGRWDFAHEIALGGRSRNGAPGVELITPLVVDSASGAAVLVNRGWVYSGDAAGVDLARHREPPQATVVGWLDELPPGRAGSPRSRAHPQVWVRLDGDSLVRSLPYRVPPFILVALADHVPGAPPIAGMAPVRRDPPRLDEGPHRSYAIQWFCFAAIALGGVGALLWTERRRAG